LAKIETQFDHQVEQALAKIEELRKVLDPHSNVLKLNRTQIIQSSSLRQILIETPVEKFMMDN